MISKDRIREELADILASARSATRTATRAAVVESAWAFRHRAHAQAVGAIGERVREIGFEADFTKYLLANFGTDELRLLSPGDLHRVARYVDRCATLLQAAS